jgi:sterol 3beta-glucosyltransferase
MSVDSYFFASFQDNEHAFLVIKRLLEERPPSDLPRVSSSISMRSSGEESARKRRDSEGTLAAVGLKKLGNVLKPLMKSSDKVNDPDADKEKAENKGISISRPRTTRLGHDSLETVRLEEPQDAVAIGMDDGYPPRQSGPPPPGMQEEGRSWTPSWIARPASKIFGSSPSKFSAGKTPPEEYSASTSDTTLSKQGGRGKQPSVTEVVEPARPSTDEEASDEEDAQTAHGGLRGPRMSFSSTCSATSEMVKTRSDFSLLEKSESGNREDEETASKFRSVFALSDKEELIDRESRKFCIG